MGPYEYRVEKMDGDYAWLVRTDIVSEESMMVARALLPLDIEEGSELLWENFSYSLKM